MLDFFVIFLTITVVLINLIVSKYTFGPSKYLFAPPVVAIFYYLLRVYPGTLDASLSNEISEALLGVLIGFLGIIFSNLTLMSLPKSKVNNSIVLYSINRKIIYAVVLLGVLSVIFTFAMLGRIPFFYMLKDLLGGGSDISMHEARRMNTLEHRDGDTVYFGQGYFRMLYMTIAPIFICAIYVVYKVKKIKTNNIKLFVV